MINFSHRDRINAMATATQPDLSPAIKLKQEEIAALTKALDDAKAGVGTTPPPATLSGDERTQFLITQSQERSRKTNDTKSALSMAKSELAQLQRRAADEAMKKAIAEGTAEFEKHRLIYERALEECKTAWEGMAAAVGKCPAIAAPTFPQVEFDAMLKLKGYAKCPKPAKGEKFTLA